MFYSEKIFQKKKRSNFKKRTNPFISRICPVIAFTLLTFQVVFAKEYNFSEQDLSIITRITANVLIREHFRRQALDETVSEKIFDEYFRILDPQKIYLSQEDINQFSDYKKVLGEQILKGDFKFAIKAYDMVVERAESFYSFAQEFFKNEIDLSLNEDWIIDRSDELPPANAAKREKLWREKIKNDIITYKLMLKSAAEKNTDLDEQQWILSFRPEERALKRYKNIVNNLKESSAIDKLEIFLSAMASVYDPYSTYMSPKSVEDFNIQMSLSLTGIGATLSQQDGYTKIVSIVPGSPAAQSGMLNPGDRIIAVAQENEEPVDVIDMPLSKVVSLIRGEKGTTVSLTILSGKKGLSSPPIVVRIKRDKVTLKEQEAQSAIIQKDTGAGHLKIGIIKLESFYFDWTAAENGSKTPKSSTGDVKKILEEFNSANVDGIIMDLRSNGGGSLFEAISLSGLFIKEGPVVQVKTSDGKIDIRYDNDPKIYSSKPLVIMMNRFSASASEIFAGAMRDYCRAIIVGDSQSFGKGTVQSLLSLNDFLKYWGINQEAGSIKVTNAKFYRINGESTQKKGIHSDIVIPSLSEHLVESSESKMRYSLDWDNVSPVGFIKWANEEDFKSSIEKVRTKSVQRIENDPDFTELKKLIEEYKKFRERKVVSLNWEKRLETYLEDLKMIKEQEKTINYEYEDDIQTERQKINPEKDIQLRETINILADFIPTAGAVWATKNSVSLKK